MFRRENSLKNQRKKLRKILVFFIISLLICINIVSSNALSKKMIRNNDSDKNLDLIMFFLRLRFRLGFRELLYSGRYFYLQYRPPVSIQAYPDVIDLKYLNKTTFQIGGKNPETLEWETMIKVAGGWSWAWWSPQITYYFEFIPPEGSQEGVWNVQFDPPLLLMKTNRENLNWTGAEDPFKTNVIIMLKPSVDSAYPTHDVVLRFNIIREETLDHLRILYGAPKWVRTQKEEYIEKQKEIDPLNEPYWSRITSTILYNRITKWLFFKNNLKFKPIEKWVDSTVEILVRVNKYHQAEIVTPLPLDIKPYEVKSIPVTIKNIGSHIDTFNFKVSTTNKNMLVTPPPALTLRPGEEAQALIGVAAPKTFLSIGSTTSIFLEAYSVYDTKSVFSNTIILSTVGINISSGPTYIFILLLITLFIIISIILYLLKKRRDKIIKKPDKPWEIPEEKKYLEILEVKDKKKYNETLDMMRDEYKSTLLWHKYYCDYLMKRRKPTGKKN